MKSAEQLLESEGVQLYHPHGNYMAVTTEKYIKSFKEEIAERFTRFRKTRLSYFVEVLDNYNNKDHMHLGKKHHLTSMRVKLIIRN